MTFNGQLVKFCSVFIGLWTCGPEMTSHNVHLELNHVDQIALPEQIKVFKHLLTPISGLYPRSVNGPSADNTNKVFGGFELLSLFTTSQFDQKEINYIGWPNGTTASQQGGSLPKYGGKDDAVLVLVGDAALLPAIGGTLEDEKLTGSPMEAAGADGYMR